MSLCYQSKIDPENQISLNFSGVDLISWTFAALCLPVNNNVVCEDAAPRIKYQALEIDTVIWAEAIELVLQDLDNPVLLETFKEHGHLFGGDFIDYRAWLGDWVEFFRTCGGYITD